MKNYSFKVKKSFLANFILAATLLLMALPSYANENIIKSVTISKAKDKVNAYDLSVDSTEQVQYKSGSDGDNSVYFELKNSIASDSIDTFYDDAIDIDNVMVKQVDKSKVRIYVKGKNAHNTQLLFANSILDNNQKRIVLNRPVNEYQSTNYDDLENSQGDLQAWDDNSFNLGHLLGSILAALKNSIAGVILVFLAIAALLYAAIRAVSSKLSQDKEPLIGLNSTKFKNDITFENVLPEVQRRPLNQGMDLEKRQETLKIAQAQLAQAHQKYQEYLQNKYQNANFENKPKSIGIDPIRQGIALNQYQKSTQNPYSNQEVINIQEELAKRNTAASAPKDFMTIPRRPKTIQKQQISNTDFMTNTTNTSPYIKRPSALDTPKKGSMKFLESVTKIYEQSGRTDLANGLKNTISKTKQTI